MTNIERKLNENAIALPNVVFTTIDFFNIFNIFYSSLYGELIKNEKGPFSNSKARLFGTLNRNDIKIRISISFICDSGGKLIPCETKE